MLGNVILRLTLCLTFQGTGLSVWEKFNSNVATKYESLFSYKVRIWIQRKKLQ